MEYYVKSVSTATSKPLDHSLPRPQTAALFARLVIAAIVLLAFWPLVWADFGGFDDAINLSHNPRLNPPTWPTIRHYWRMPEYDLYIPVTYTIWAAVAWLAYAPQADPAGVHLNPHAFHLLNVLLHALSALVVFQILRRALPVAALLAAAGGALVFALHPLQVEPVGWAAGMKDVLGGMLALVALWQYVLVVQSSSAARRRWHWIWGTIAFLTAMLAKPSAVMVPAIAWVIDVMLVSRDVRRATVRAAPWLALALPCIVWTKLFQPAAILAEATPLRVRPLIATDALAFYFWKLAWPLRLGVDYGRTPQLVTERGWIALTWIVPALLIVAAWLVRRRAVPISTSILIFILALLPVLGLVPFDFQAYSSVADHYVYVAMLGPALAAAWLASRSPQRVWSSILLLIVILLAIGSRLQTRHWRDAPAIYNHALMVNSRSWASHAQLAAYFGARGQYETALRHARDAASINPHAFTVHNLVAQNLTKLGRTDDAIDAYRAALAINPRDGLANINLANLLADQKQFDQAIEHYQIVLQLNPNDAVGWANLGGVFEETGRLDEAIDHYQRALTIDPNHLEARIALDRATRARQTRPATTTVPSGR